MSKLTVQHNKQFLSDMTPGELGIFNGLQNGDVIMRVTTNNAFGVNLTTGMLIVTDIRVTPFKGKVTIEQ